MFNFFLKKKKKEELKSNQINKLPNIPELEIKEKEAFDLTTQESSVNEFIRVYEEWNNWAIKIPNNHSETINIISETYQKIINIFCHESVVPQNVAYGDEPFHSLKNETIIKVETDGDKACVFTKSKNMDNFEAEYEYQLIRENDQWYLKSLLYVCEDGKFECL